MSGFSWKSKKEDRVPDKEHELSGLVDSPILDGSEENLGGKPSFDEESHKFQEDPSAAGGKTAGPIDGAEKSSAALSTGSDDSGEMPIPAVDVAGDDAGAVPASDSAVAQLEEVSEEAGQETIREEQSFVKADDAEGGDSGEMPIPAVDVAGDDAGAVPAPDSAVAQLEEVSEEAGQEIIREEQSFVEVDDVLVGDSGEMPIPAVDVAGDDAGAVPASDSAVAQLEEVSEEAGQETIREEQSFVKADDAEGGDSGEMPIPAVDVAGDDAGAVSAPDSAVAQLEEVSEEAGQEIIREEQSFVEVDDVLVGDSGEMPIPAVDVAGDDAGAVSASDSAVAQLEEVPEEAGQEIIREEQLLVEADDVLVGDSGEMPIPAVDVAGDDAGAVSAPDSAVAQLEEVPEEAGQETIREEQSFVEADDARGDGSGEMPIPAVDVAGDDAGAVSVPDSAVAQLEEVPEEAGQEVIREEQLLVEADDALAGDSGEMPIPAVDVAGDDAGAVSAPDSAVAQLEEVPEEAGQEVIREEQSLVEADDAGGGDSGEMPIPAVDVAGDDAGAVSAPDSAVAQLEEVPEEAGQEVIREEQSLVEADDALAGDSGEMPIPAVDVASDDAGAVSASDSAVVQPAEVPEEARQEVIREEQSLVQADDVLAGDVNVTPVSDFSEDVRRENKVENSLGAQSPIESSDDLADEAEKDSREVVSSDAVSFVPLLDPEKLSVELKCELGSIHASLGEIGLLKPGMIVDLKKDLAGPVNLFVNKKLVARGEPVKLGEGLGIRIVSLSEKSQAD